MKLRPPSDKEPVAPTPDDSEAATPVKSEPAQDRSRDPEDILRAYFEEELGKLQRPPRDRCIGYAEEDEEAKRAYAAKLQDVISSLFTPVGMSTLAAICSSEGVHHI